MRQEDYSERQLLNYTAVSKKGAVQTFPMEQFGFAVYPTRRYPQAEVDKTDAFPIIQNVKLLFRASLAVWFAATLFYAAGVLLVVISHTEVDSIPVIGGFMGLLFLVSVAVVRLFYEIAQFPVPFPWIFYHTQAAFVGSPSRWVLGGLTTAAAPKRSTLLSNFFGAEMPDSVSQADEMYNISATNPANQMNYVNTYQIPAGTTVYQGTVAGGSGIQVWIWGGAQQISTQLLAW